MYQEAHLNFSKQKQYLRPAQYTFASITTMHTLPKLLLTVLLVMLFFFQLYYNNKWLLRIDHWLSTTNKFYIITRYVKLEHFTRDKFFQFLLMRQICEN